MRLTSLSLGLNKYRSKLSHLWVRRPIPAAAGKDQQHGLPAGEYHVTVIKMQSAGGAASLSNPPKNVLPAKYATPDASPLSATITADGDNVVELRL